MNFILSKASFIGNMPQSSLAKVAKMETKKVLTHIYFS
jgi:hypothetical protein